MGLSTKECLLYGFFGVLGLLCIVILCQSSIQESKQRDIEKARIVQEQKTERAKQYIKVMPWNRDKK